MAFPGWRLGLGMGSGAGMGPRPSTSAERAGLVGRGAVLADLRAAQEQARAGTPTLVSLVGDAGSGKTAVLRAFLRQSGHRAEVSLGSAQEDGGIPYHALSGLLSTLDIAPGDIEPALRQDTEWALWRSVTDELRARAEHHLVVVGVDDLHWADEASIRLLDHLTTAIADQGVVQPIHCMIVLAGRVRGTDPRIQRLLSRAGDDPDGHTIELRGLDPSEVGTMVLQTTGAQLTPTEARELHHRTGGNPLLVRLVARSVVGSDPDASVPLDALAMSAAWNEQLSTLDPAVRQALDAAAIHGDPFDIALIGRVLDDPDPTPRFIAARDAGLVDHDDGWRFTHPELARHLRLALGGDRRQRLHALMADAITDGAGDAPYSVLALDHHLQRAGGAVADARRWQVAALAGDEALAMGAWARAVYAYSVVLPHVEDLAVDDRERTNLVVNAATALIMDSQPGAAIPVLSKAITLAERTGETALWGDVLIRAVRNRLSGTLPQHGWPEVPALRTFAEHDGDPAQRSMAWVTLADVAFEIQDQDEGLRCCAQARRLAEDSGDPETLAFAEYADGLQHLGRLEAREACGSFRRCASRAAEADNDVLTSWWKVRLPLSEYLNGDVSAASRHLDAAVDHGRRTQLWADQSLAEACRSSIAALRGSFAESEARAEHAITLYRRSNYPGTAGVVFPQLVCTKALQGETDAVADVISLMAAETGRVPGWLAPLADHEAGLPPDVESPMRSGRSLPPLGLNSLLGLMARAQLSRTSGTIAVAQLAARLQTAFERGTLWTPGWTMSVPRALALTALDLGDVEGSRQWLRLADDAAGRAGALVEQAQVALQVATVERSVGDVRQATAATLRALEIAERIGAYGLALRVRQALDAPIGTDAEAVAAGVERVLLFTDITGSTNLNVVVGDDRFVALLEEHNEIIRRRALAHGGVVFHNTGDGYGVWFTDAVDAVSCAVEVHDDLSAAAQRHPGQQVSVRIGVAVGTPTSLDGDLFGVDVVRAARLCSVADAETVVVDGTTHERVRHRGDLRVHDLGPTHLKGFPAPEPAYRIDCSR